MTKAKNIIVQALIKVLCAITIAFSCVSCSHSLGLGGSSWNISKIYLKNTQDTVFFSTEKIFIYVRKFSLRKQIIFHGIDLKDGRVSHRPKYFKINKLKTSKYHKYICIEPAMISDAIGAKTFLDLLEEVYGKNWEIFFDFFLHSENKLYLNKNEATLENKDGIIFLQRNKVLE